ncbi:glycosyltransferase family 2 protein [Vibrio sp. LQ2]|uniref:glycosyltransferase family 2 protein n=1 Tax=Vibrio TaxID=662 RepID=UPI001F42FC3A|nr:MULTISPECIES: glycosyltransferase family 2 protein [Vibrio]MCE7622162.1 glycosyltransferase family 2 protein [Vibrio fluvialis]UPO64776.1 glycosyl transferase family 2 [Vibrio fluvialis]USP05274.1 glycosyltransferase family 2 protein [Vibrio sp. LQ2]
MTVFVSIVSHGHGDLIRELNCVSNLIDDFQVIVKSNKSGDDYKEFVCSQNFHWINDNYDLGFGKNNNVNYNYCKSVLGMNPDDIFIVLNPDVLVNNKDVFSLINRMNADGVLIATINLCKSFEPLIYDFSVRKFPQLFDFVSSFLGLGNSTILDKKNIKCSIEVDWAAGSFLAFKASHYAFLFGFDEKYFMYCEDTDICLRSGNLGHKPIFYPDIFALHLAKHSNRRLFSRHFFWHIRSVFRFLSSRRGLTKPSSSVII